MNMKSNSTESTVDKIKAIEFVQRAVEVAMAEVEQYIKSTNKPTSERAREIIENVLESHNCESSEGLIVAGGKASAEPHESGSGVLEVGVPIVIDIFPRSKDTGYFADMTRTICLGAPTKELQKMYDTVREAQELAFGMVAPGVKGATIHQFVWDFFEQAGYKTSGKGTLFTYAEGFVHSLGHGVGLVVHDLPRLSANSEDVLQVGDVITIEPGLYYHHIGGVRLEDMLLVTEDGYRNLTHYKKNLW